MQVILAHSAPGHCQVDVEKQGSCVNLNSGASPASNLGCFQAVSGLCLPEARVLVETSREGDGGLSGVAELSSLVSGCRQMGEEQTEHRLLYKVFFFVIMVGFVHCSVGVIQRWGAWSDSHGFWSGSGGLKEVPLPTPQALTHLKEAEQQRHSTRMGKGVPRASRMVGLT